MVKKKKQRKSSILLKINLILYTITLFLLLILNIVPIKFLVIITSIIFLLFSLLYMLSRNKKSNLGINIFFIITIIVNIFLISYLFKANKFLFSINSNIRIENYSIITNSNFNTDINSIKNIGIIKDDSYDLIISKLDKFNFKMKTNYKNYEELLKSINQNTDAVIINNSILEIYLEEHPEYNENIKILKKFSITKKINNDLSNVNIEKEIFSVYISGIDTYESISTSSRSDVNILAFINPQNKNILLINIPRDYYVKLHDIGTLNDKLTHAGIYGINTSIETIKDLLDIDINYFVKVNFTFLIDLVDTIDDIDVESIYEFKTDDFSYKKGLNTLNGEQALAFVRERKNLPEGDLSRAKNQQIVLKAIVNKLNTKSLILNYNSILNSLSNNIQTNINQNDISKIIKIQLNNNDSWQIQSINLTGYNDYQYTNSYSSQKLYVMLPNQESIEACKLEIKRFYNS